MHIDHIAHRVEKTLARVLGTPKAPVQSQVVDDIQRGRAAALARDREERDAAALRSRAWHHIDADGRVRMSGPIVQPAPGTFPPGWTDVHSDEYQQEED